MVEKLLVAGIPSVVVVIATVIATWYSNRKLVAFKNELLERVNARKFLFEKEMEFYQHFFKLITDLRNPLLEYTAAVRRSPRDQTRVEWEQQHGSEFRKAFNELYIATMSYRPFYPEDMFTEVETLLKTCYRRLRQHEDMVSEMINDRRNSPDPGPYQKVSGLSEQILEMTDPLIIRMKSRIESFRGE